MTSSEAITNAATSISGFESGLDLLINNAGVGGVGYDDAEFGNIEATDFSQVISTNTLGPLLTSQAPTQLLKAGQRPVVASIS